MKSVHDFKKIDQYKEYLRTYFAALAMQSMASVVYSGYNEAYKRQLEDWQLKYGQNILVREAMAKDSIELADELLKQLEDGNNKS